MHPSSVGTVLELTGYGSGVSLPPRLDRAPHVISKVERIKQIKDQRSKIKIVLVFCPSTFYSSIIKLHITLA